MERNKQITIDVHQKALHAHGKRFWSGNSPVAGQQFEYSFDDIGNRTSTRSGGDQHNGSYLRAANYFANNLNQYTSRDVPPYIDIFGSARTNATVSIWTPDGYWAQTVRHAEWCRGELALNNSTGAFWLTITYPAVLNTETNDIITNSVGNTFVPKNQENFTYDLEGNLSLAMVAGQIVGTPRTGLFRWKA